MSDYIKINKTFFIDNSNIIEQVAGSKYVIYDTKTGEMNFAEYYPVPKVVNGKQIIHKPLVNESIKYSQIILPDAPWMPETDYPIIYIFDKIKEKASKYLYISPEEEVVFNVQILIAIASWFLDSMFSNNAIEKVSGLIGIVGTSGGGKKRWISVMRQIAYRPLYVLNTTRVPSLFRLVDPWGSATLCIDEADQRDTSSESEVVQFLNARFDGTPIARYNATTRRNDIFRSFGLTALALRRMPQDEGVVSRMIKINATPSPVQLPEVAEESMTADFAEIRNYLLYLRLKWWGKLKFTNRTGLPVEHSWRGRETLTLIKTLEQIDTKLEDLIFKFSEELTKREVINLSQTWDGVILNEIYNFISDENSLAFQKGKGLIFVKEYKNRNDDTDEIPLNLSYLSKKLNIGASEIKRSLTQFKISIIERAYINGRRCRGILHFQYPQDIDRILARYVPEYARGYLSKIADEMMKQNTLDNDDGPHGTDGPAHDISERGDKTKNIDNNIIKENESNINIHKYKETENKNRVDICTGVLSGPSVPSGKDDFYLKILNNIKDILKLNAPETEFHVEREYLNVKNYIKYTYQLDEQEAIDILNYWQENNLIYINGNQIILQGGYTNEQ